MGGEMGEREEREREAESNGVNHVGLKHRHSYTVTLAYVAVMIEGVAIINKSSQLCKTSTNSVSIETKTFASWKTQLLLPLQFTDYRGNTLITWFACVNQLMGN